jgi:capsular exopolysaccharide synthesis family protein
MPRNLIVHENAKSPVAEAFRTLRTNLHFARIDPGIVSVMFTSAGPEEGKSTVAANTAIAMAQAGKRVLLLDADLRKPSQHRTFRVQNKGLTNHLADGTPFTELIQETEVPNLSLLTSGPIPPNPSELLGSARMKAALAELAADYEAVVIDSTPVVAVTDACVLASEVDGVVLVVNSQLTRPEMAQRAKELLGHANGKILGVVLNKVEIAEEYSYYYYYYGHGDKKKKKGN